MMAITLNGWLRDCFGSDIVTLRTLKYYLIAQHSNTKGKDRVGYIKFSHIYPNIHPQTHADRMTVYNKPSSGIWMTSPLWGVCLNMVGFCRCFIWKCVLHLEPLPHLRQAQHALVSLLLSLTHSLSPCLSRCYSLFLFLFISYSLSFSISFYVIRQCLLPVSFIQ